MVPLQIKGSSADVTVMIPGEEMKSLQTKQSEGVPIVSSSVPPDGTVPAQANSDKEHLAVSTIQLVDMPVKTFRLIKPKDNLAASPKTVDAQPNSLQESSPAVSVSTVQPQSVTSQGLHITVQPGVQSLPIPSPLTSSPVISVNSVASLSPYIPYTTFFPTAGDVGTCSSSNMLPISQSATTVNNVQLGNVVRLSYNVATLPAPSNAPKIQKINVLPLNSSACPTQSTGRMILPKTITIPGFTQRVVERPVGVHTLPILMNCNEKLRNSATSQPLVSENNDPAKKNGELKVNVQLSGGVVTTMASQSGTRTVQSRPANAKVSSKTVGQRLKIKKISLMPKRTREVMVSRAAPAGGVHLEMRAVPVDKEADKKLENHQYTVKEVSNNPSESGVAKKYVVVPVSNCGPVPSPPMTQPTSSTTTDTSSATNIPLSSVPPWRKNKPGDLGNYAQDHQSAFQWHHPYTGDPLRAAEAEVVRDSGTENDQVMISDDDDAQPVPGTSSLPCHVAGVPESNYETVCISDDDEKPGIATSSVPPLANSGMPSVMSTHLSSDSTENSPDNDPFSLRIESDSIQSNVQYSGGNKFQWHQPCTDSETLSARDNFTLIEDSNSIVLSGAPNEKVQVKAANNEGKRTGSSKTWPRKPVDDKGTKKKKKKKDKKKKETKNVEKLKMKKIKSASCAGGSKTDVTNNVSSSTRPTLTPGDVARILRASPSLGSTFQWHHPTTATDSEKSAGDLEAVEIKTEPICLHSNSQHAQGPSSPECGPGPGRTEDTLEFKYSPVAEGPSGNGQDFSILKIDSVQSVAISKCITMPSTSEQNQNHSSYDRKDLLPSSTVVHDQREAISANDSPSPCLDVQPKKRKAATLKKMQLNLKRRMKAMADSLQKSTNSPTVLRPLRRAKVGGKDKSSQKFNSKLPSSASAIKSRAEKKKNVSISDDFLAKQESSKIDSNVLRDCIVRKTIQDCYLDGVIPTIDKIHSTCCGSGLDVPKTSVEQHLTSIGYKWVTCKSQRVLLEDHRVTAERIKYLNKLKKNQRKNLVYIFVSEYVKRNGNVWQLSPTDVVRPSRDSVCVVLHAVSNRCLLEGGLEIIKLGLFGLRRSDVISWLQCKVLPNIPCGSVVIFGNHPVFEKDKETEERPNIGHSKEDIVAWLASHKVTPVNPKSPKAFLLCKVNNVILPKTSIFDQLILQNDSVPLHLPKHHSDLNPVEFIWRDIIDEIFKSPEISSPDSFQDFVTRRFSASSPMPLVACNLVRNFECSYREFDFRSDELFDKLLSGAGPDTNDAADSAPVAAKKNTESECPVCLCSKRFKGFRCGNCKRFWYKLTKDHQSRRKTGVSLPVCNKTSHMAARPPDCLGCRRYRYEEIVLNKVSTNNATYKRNYVLPIPPVTEMGKKCWPKTGLKKKPKAKKS